MKIKKEVIIISNYTIIHMHTMLSNPTTVADSITHYQSYIDKAVELGMKAMCFTEHGNIFEWTHKKNAVEKAGMKYIHGVEMYVTKSLDKKVRDNYHTTLIAKNKKGVEELNYLISAKVAYKDDGHFYYTPRITFEELINTSDNIIVTSACLGGILGKGDKEIKIEFIKFMNKNKHRCYLEIQHHNVEDQIKYNEMLYNIHKNTSIPLILGTDTHSLNDTHANGVKILQNAKNIHFENENGWDLTFKTYEELINSHKWQKNIPFDVYIEAIENTNVLADSIEPFEVDKSNKYPVLYKDSIGVFKKLIVKYVKAKNIKLNKVQKDRIKYEFNVYKKTGSIDYILLEEDIKRFCREKGIGYGYSRGSVSGSYIAYLLKITDMDSIKYNLNFERFINPERASLADIDTDYPPSRRDEVKRYLHNKKGLYCADIVTFNTIALKGSLKEVGRSLNIPLSIIDNITKNLDNEETSLRKEYPTLFKHADLLNGVIISVGVHPGGVLVSPYPIEGSVGTIRTKTSEFPVTCLNMKEVDDLNFVKLDMLGLDSVEILNETCNLAGIERLTPENTDYEDEKVWNDMLKSGLGIFQWEGDYAHSYYKELFNPKIIQKIKNSIKKFSYIDLLSIANGAIRPAGESYRDSLAKGIIYDNGHPALQEFLSSTLGYLVFQEQIIEFLNKFCGFSASKADIIRRGFAKKTGTEDYIPQIKAGFIKTMTEKYNTPVLESEHIIVNFLQIIEDASNYLFSINHADSYSRLGYACAWLRYYYPIEFLTTSLTVQSNNKSKTVGRKKTSKIIDYINKFTNIKVYPIEYGKSKSGYSFDKKKNIIYKGISSIKYCNKIIAEELYDISQKYNCNNDFFKLIEIIKNNSVINFRQLKILTGLNFFKAYGKNAKLLKCIELFETFYGRKQFSISDLDKLGVEESILIKYAGKKTSKLYKGIDVLGYLKEFGETINNEPLSMKKQVEFEMKYLEYTKVIHEHVDKNIYIIIKYKTYQNKNKPYVIIRQIRTGNEIKARVKNANLFKKNPFEIFDILVIDKLKTQKGARVIDGEWLETGRDEQILVEWDVY